MSTTSTPIPATPTLADLLAELEASPLQPPPELPPEHPSSFGPLRLPAPGQPAEPLLLAAAGLPAELLPRLWSHRGEPQFFATLIAAGHRLGTRAPRLVRQVGWALMREEPHRVHALATDTVTHARLSDPGIIALLCDLVEEAPTALAAHRDALLATLLREDIADPFEGKHQLSDLFCLMRLDEAFVVRALAPVWKDAPSPRARQVLLRAAVFHRAVPLTRHEGHVEERIHHPKTRYQAYSYELISGDKHLRILDLTRDLQQNASDLPKYSPSMYLRRFLGKTVQIEGFIDHSGDEFPVLIARFLVDPDAAASPAPPPKARRMHA